MHLCSVLPLLFLNIEGRCVSCYREWKMPFTLWYGRSGCTGSKSSARKKRLRAVSSLKNVLWCERGKCMQPRVHQLYVCVLFLGGGDCGESDWKGYTVKIGASWVLRANLLVLLGLWCDSKRRLISGWFLPFYSVSVYHGWLLFKRVFTLGSFSLKTLDCPLPLTRLVCCLH